jgi:hypothetical protein
VQHQGHSWGANTPKSNYTKFVRSEVARGRIIPNNINHPESEPMMGNFAVKIKCQHWEWCCYLNHRRRRKIGLGLPLGNYGYLR